MPNAPYPISQFELLLGVAIRFLMTRAGIPTTTEKGGISLLTTFPAPITLLLPMVTPSNTLTPCPSQQSIFNHNSLASNTSEYAAPIMLHTNDLQTSKFMLVIT